MRLKVLNTTHYCFIDLSRDEMLYISNPPEGPTLRQRLEEIVSLISYYPDGVYFAITSEYATTSKLVESIIEEYLKPLNT